MRRALIVASIGWLGATWMVAGGDKAPPSPRPAPPFPSSRAKDWIGPPVVWEAMRGKVVVIDVWAFECVNCARSVPWIKDARARLAERGLEFVGVHSPELETEYDKRAVREHAQKQGLDFPQFLDNDHVYWRVLKNEYWPTFHLVDRCGRLRGNVIGEVHVGQASGQRIEEAIQALLAEDPAECGGSR